MNYYNDIKQELINNEINRKVKNYSINKSDLNAYYNVYNNIFINLYYSLQKIGTIGLYKEITVMEVFYAIVTSNVYRRNRRSD